MALIDAIKKLGFWGCVAWLVGELVKDAVFSGINAMITEAAAGGWVATFLAEYWPPLLGIAVFGSLYAHGAWRERLAKKRAAAQSEPLGVPAPEAPDSAVQPASTSVAQRDWSPRQAMEWWYSQRPDKDPVDFFHELRQAASDGAVKIWGRENCEDFEMDSFHLEPFVAIPAAFWKDNWLDWDTYIRGDERSIREATAPPSGTSGAATYYSDLRVTSLEIKARWPAINPG